MRTPDSMKALPGPSGEFATSVATAGLSGADALPDAIPFNDGVENLLKYAFNMNLGGPDSSRMTAGGTAGLPDASLDLSGETPVWRIELVRRKGVELTYSPLTSTTLAADGFGPMTGTTTVTEIDAEWERVVIEKLFDPATTPRCFSRVRVNIDDGTGGGGNDDGEQPLRLVGPDKITTLGIPFEENLTFGVYSGSAIVSATAQWISGGKVIKTEDLPTLSSRTNSCPKLQGGSPIVCLKKSLTEAEAIGPSTLTVTVVNTSGETAVTQTGEFFPNAGPFNGVWAGPVTQTSNCGDDDTSGETLTIIHTGNNRVAIYGLIFGSNWVSGKIDNGVISATSSFISSTESGIPIRVTEWEATLVGPGVLEGSASFTSGEDSLTNCSGSFSFSFTRQ